MIDKLQKIKEWISKEQEGLMDAQGNFEYPEHEGAYHILCNLDAYIDSLPNEPVSKDFEMALAEMVAKAQICVVEPWAVAAQWKDELIKLAKSEEPVNRTPADVESAMQEVEEKSRAFTEAHQGENADTILAQMRDLREATNNYVLNARKGYQRVMDETDRYICNAFKAGAKWQKAKTLSDMKKAVTGKMFQFSMENVEVWGDEPDGNGKTIKLKGRVTFQVSNPESIVDALIKIIKE